jgi:hypothetical protein
VYNISQSFRKELRNRDQQIACKAVLLDAQLREIPKGTFTTAGVSALNDVIVDGNVDVDRDRGTRRTGELTIINNNGEFSPDDGVSGVDGLFYINRHVRLYRGVVLAGGEVSYAPIGTLMIDAVDVFVERNISVVNLTMSDRWKKLQKSYITVDKLYPVGTHFNTIVRDFAAASGADYPLAPNLDPLTGPERNVANTTISWRAAYTVHRGESRGDLIKELANKFGVDIYFDVEGRLTTNDRKDPKDGESVWSFYSSTESEPFGMLTSMRRTMSDDVLYNHIFVIGLGDEKAPVVWEKKDTDPNSPTSIDLIGDRVMIVENQTWKTQTEVSSAGQKLWDNKFKFFEEVTIDVICHPALEADDVISVREPTSKTDTSYRIISMNVPLTTSKQTIRVTRDVYGRRNPSTGSV